MKCRSSASSRRCKQHAERMLTSLSIWAIFSVAIAWQPSRKNPPPPPRPRDIRLGAAPWSRVAESVEGPSPVHKTTCVALHVQRAASGGMAETEMTRACVVPKFLCGCWRAQGSDQRRGRLPPEEAFSMLLECSHTAEITRRLVAETVTKTFWPRWNSISPSLAGMLEWDKQAYQRFMDSFY